MFAAHNDLGNLVAVVDRNDLAILGETELLLRLEPLEAKFESFGWRVLIVDGHDLEALIKTLATATINPEGPPCVVIANTTKGKGVSYMEGRHEWHNKLPSPELLDQGREELRSAMETLISETR